MLGKRERGPWPHTDVDATKMAERHELAKWWQIGRIVALPPDIKVARRTRNISGKKYAPIIIPMSDIRLYIRKFVLEIYYLLYIFTLSYI